MSHSSTSSSDRGAASWKAPGRASLALLWFVLLLAVAEALLWGADRTRGTPPGLSAGPTLHVALGSSRTLRGLRPLSVEREMEWITGDDVWVANVTRRARTMIGLAQLYESQIAPRVSPAHQLGTLAIEVRGSSLNDSRIGSGETLFSYMIVANFASLGPEATLASWFGRLRIADLRTSIDRGWPGMPAWAEGARGWEPFKGERRPDLDEARWRRSYRGTLLVDYALGGIQTRALRYLIRSARRDGWTPVLYLLPITPKHRSFYAPDDYDAFLSHVAEVAAQERVPWFDLDSGHDFAQSEFWDTHHLGGRAARRLSRCFGRFVLLRSQSDGAVTRSLLNPCARRSR